MKRRVGMEGLSGGVRTGETLLSFSLKFTVKTCGSRGGGGTGLHGGTFFLSLPHFIFFSEVSFRLKVMAGTGVAERDDFERQGSWRVTRVSRADWE